MAITLVQTSSHGNAASNLTVASTWGSNTTSGNLIVVAIVSKDSANATHPSVASVTDSQGNVYKKVLTQDDGNGTPAAAAVLDIWYSSFISGGTTPTITATGNQANELAMICREYSGLVNSGPLDCSKSQGQSVVTSMSSLATVVTDQANALVVGALVYGGADKTVSAGGSFGNLGSVRYTGAGVGDAVYLEDQSVATTGAQTATFTSVSTATPACGVAVFKATRSPFNPAKLRPHPFSPGLAR